MLIAVNFHYIKTSFDYLYPSIFGKTPKEFRTQLELLSRFGHFVSSDDIVQALEGDKNLPDKSFVITFDDGLKEQYHLALPILEEMGIPAIFFVNTMNLVSLEIQNVHKIHLLRSQVDPKELREVIYSYLALSNIKVNPITVQNKGVNHYKYDKHDVAELKYLLNFILPKPMLDACIDKLYEREFGDEKGKIHDEIYMDIGMVKDLSNKGYLGSHAHEHLPIGELNKEEKGYQVTESQRILSEICDKPITAFSYPYGSLLASKNVSEFLKISGFRYSFTMERAVNPDLNQAFGLSRFDNNDMPGGKAFNQQLINTNIFDTLPKRKWTI